MVGAACLLFISQFFNYSSREFTRPVTDSNLQFHGGSLTPSQTGWESHSWYAGLIIGLIAFLFFSNTRSLPYYIISIIIMLALSLGNGTGAIMGIISVAIAAYAIYLKIKENKKIPPLKVV